MQDFTSFLLVDDILAFHVEALGPDLDEHHELFAYRGTSSLSVESFRRADLVDVSLGLFRFGLTSEFVPSVRAAFPNAGFHARLLALTGRQFLRSPLRPLPMVRW